jgi:hydrogenase-1 operon protein HyaE
MTATALPPLLERLVTHHGATRVDRTSLDAFESGTGDAVLFFSGDPVRFPEGLDVAVVLPELRAASGRDFAIGVVTRDSEDTIARRYGSQRWPALVFLRDGEYLATVSGMKDWADYVDEVRQALAATPSRRPSIGIPVVSADGGAAGCA